MVCRIRLQRMGVKNNPIYRLVVVDSRRSVSSGNIVEKIGVYDPRAKSMNYMFFQEALNPQDKFKTCYIDIDRVKYWLGQGAQPSEHVLKLLANMGLAPPKPQVIPKGWDPKVWDESFKQAHLYWKRKNKIEEQL
ncbi:hypothetical protein FDP41_010655 [Naegleria fowleri]|uniref:Ribosomal protein S16 n=1 Tax=Naegleria fowleri TaxID=5763 RepID=A0A6A5CDB6_NAEFO|nr:uncharacterized protein FDP41_010655 [Naegleria fowleri]KAF0983590.1 hypothetical protein FDP41_010655 [Naegleria fowleri]